MPHVSVTGYRRTRFHEKSPACPPWCRSPHEEAEGDPKAKSYHFSLDSTVRIDDGEGVAGTSIVQDGDGPPQLLVSDCGDLLVTVDRARALARHLSLMADCAEESVDPGTLLR